MINLFNGYRNSLKEIIAFQVTLLKSESINNKEDKANIKVGKNLEKN